MTIAEIFYLTATIVLLLMVVASLYVAYQVYRITKLLKSFSQKVSDISRLISTTKLAAQAAILKGVVNALGSKGGEEKDEE